MITFRTLGKLGRFGNQLFQYAGTRLYAELNGFPAAFPGWVGTAVFQDIRSYTTLEHLRSRLLPTVQLTDMKSIGTTQQVQRLVRLWCQRDIRELYEHPSDNVDLYGYLQDPFSLQLLRAHKTRVRSWFRWAPHVDLAFRQASQKYAPWVGVHIRRGDLVKRGTIVPVRLYDEALSRRSSGSAVYVSSDDPAIAKELTRYAPIRPANPLPDMPDFVFDFWMLANASTVYGCGSTFSWWAAYIGNKDSYYSPPLTHTWPKGYVPRLERQIL